MAQVIDTDDKVARFRAEVLPRLVAHYRPSKVLVFGSRARGEALQHSDLDVLIVAEAFRAMKWQRAFRSGRPRRARSRREHLTAVCFSPYAFMHENHPRH